MNNNFTKPILPAALFILLSAVLLPGTYNGFSAKGVYLADPYTSVDSTPDNDIGTSDGDDQKITRAPDEIPALPAPLYIISSPVPAPAADIAFTVSQARAPPQF